MASQRALHSTVSPRGVRRSTAAAARATWSARNVGASHRLRRGLWARTSLLGARFGAAGARSCALAALRSAL